MQRTLLGLALIALVGALLLSAGCPKKDAPAAPSGPSAGPGAGATGGDATGAKAVWQIPDVTDTGVVEVNRDNLADFKTRGQGAAERMPQEYKDLLQKIKDAGVKPNDGEKYVAIGISTGAEYWVATREGLEDIASELGVEADFQGPLGQVPAEQADIMDQIIASKPAGILIAPGSPEVLGPSIDRAIAEGIPVITFDTDAPESDRIAYIGTENYEAGRKGAEILARLVGGQGKVAISTRPGQWNLDERVRGYEEYFAENNPGIEMLPPIDDETKREMGEKRAAPVIQNNPDLAGFAGVNAVSGLGISAAIRSLNKIGQIKVVAMDGDEGILKLIEEGIIDASIAQRQYYMTYLGVMYLYGLNHGVFSPPSEGGAAAPADEDKPKDAESGSSAGAESAKPESAPTESTAKPTESE